MAVLNIQEQQEVDTLKAWWGQYGRFVLAGVVTALVLFGAWQGWRWYQNKQMNEAGVLYDQMLSAADAGDVAKVNSITATLTDQYGRTGFARLAALVAARVALDSNDAADAQTRLEWLVAHAKADATRDLARLRLATVLLAEKKYPNVLTLLDAKHGAAWDTLYASVKGDALAAQGRYGEARNAYQYILDHADAQSPLPGITQMKLDALTADAGTTATTATPATPATGAAAATPATGAATTTGARK